MCVFTRVFVNMVDGGRSCCHKFNHKHSSLSPSQITSTIGKQRASVLSVKGASGRLINLSPLDKEEKATLMVSPVLKHSEFSKIFGTGQPWWLMPIILDTPEAEIGKMVFRSQSTYNVCKTPSQPMAGCSGKSLSSPATQEVQTEGFMPSQPWHKVRPYLKNNQDKRAGCMAKVADCLPSK
jgi:hypothetical protein